MTSTKNLGIDSVFDRRTFIIVASFTTGVVVSCRAPAPHCRGCRPPPEVQHGLLNFYNVRSTNGRSIECTSHRNAHC